jgi:hypothetical protein
MPEVDDGARPAFAAATVLASPSSVVRRRALVESDGNRAALPATLTCCRRVLWRPVPTPRRLRLGAGAETVQARLGMMTSCEDLCRMPLRWAMRHQPCFPPCPRMPVEAGRSPGLSRNARSSGSPDAQEVIRIPRPRAPIRDSRPPGPEQSDPFRRNQPTLMQAIRRKCTFE